MFYKIYFIHGFSYYFDNLFSVLWFRLSFLIYSTKQEIKWLFNGFLKCINFVNNQKCMKLTKNHQPSSKSVLTSINF